MLTARQMLQDQEADLSMVDESAATAHRLLFEEERYVDYGTIDWNDDFYNDPYFGQPVYMAA